MAIPFQVFTPSTSIYPGALLFPHLWEWSPQHTMPWWAGHTKSLYLPRGDDRGQLPHWTRSSSDGGECHLPSLGHLPNGTPQGDEGYRSPSPHCALPRCCRLAHKAVESAKCTNSLQEALCRSGEGQVHRVRLLNQLGIKLKQWPNSLYLYSLQWSLSSTFWSGLCTFLFKYQFKEKKKKKALSLRALSPTWSSNWNLPQSHPKTT